MSKRFIFFFLVICLGFFLRIYKVEQYPAGFYSDESLVGYEANSILRTGKDQYGNFLPVTFKAFGDYRPGLYIYSTVPSIYLFGLSEFGTRLPSVLFSTFTIPVVMLISYELFKKSKAALLGGLLFAVSPWSIQFARMAHDTNLATLLTAIVILLLLKSLNGKKYFIGIAVFSSLSLYVYYTTRVFIPLFLIAIAVFYYQKFIPYGKQIVISVLVAVILLLPFTPVLFNRETGWSRIDAVSLTGDAGIKAKILQFHQEDVLAGISDDRMFHNKLVDISVSFLSGYFSHFDPNFLFTYGDPNRLYSTPGNGILFYVELVFILYGIITLIKMNHPRNRFLLAWLVLGIIPDALTRFAPAAARIHLVLPMVSIIGGLGFYRLYVLRKRTIFYFVWTLAVIGIFLGNISYFIHTNLIHQSLRYGKEWTFGVKQAAQYIKENENHYDKIWITPKEAHWVTYLFYLQYPIEKTQREIVLSKKNEYGLGWVYAIGKYRFEDIPKVFDYTKNILYVGRPEEFCKYAVPKEIVYYLNHDIAFLMMTTAELKRVEIICTLPDAKTTKPQSSL